MDFQMGGYEQFAFRSYRCQRYSQGNVSQVGKDAPVQGAHGVPQAAIDLHFYHCPTFTYLNQAHAQALHNWWGRQVAT